MVDQQLRGLRVLISGAGIAGPAAAYWFARYGAETTVVEVAPALRHSGSPVDFRGPTHLGILLKMGILDALQQVQTHAGAGCFVDECGRELFTLPADFAGGDVEVRRRDLSQILYDHSAERVEYLFDERIIALRETAGGMGVDFAGGQSRTFDIVIGADGLHSGVRRLLFGDESQFVKHLGYYVAYWDIPNDLAAREIAQFYTVPGRMASIWADPREPSRAVAMSIFASPQREYRGQDLDWQKGMITNALTGMGWHVPQLLASLRDVPEVYFDAIGRVSVPHWSVGRAALLGDAAHGVTLGGMGAGMGIVGAYVLAGELARARGDHRTAFAVYEQRMRRYAGRWQRGVNPGKFFAPVTAPGLWLRDRLFRTRTFQRLLVAGSTSLATSFGLPDYVA